MNLSVCFTDEFLSKFDLSKGFKCRRKPSKHTNWNQEWQWMVSHSKVSKPGFRIYSRIMKAWKTMVKRIKEVPSHLVKEIGRHGNIWWASQFMGALCVWNTERGHVRRKNWALCHWAWLGGANNLKGQVCRCFVKIKERRLGALWVWNTERGHGRQKKW